MEFVIPSIEAILNFNEWCQPLFAKIAKNDRQTQTFSCLRDALLPKLMSGEVRVKV